MDFLSRFVFHSKVVPGAVVTLKRPTAQTRAVFLMSQSKCLARIREIQRERKALDEDYRQFLAKANSERKVTVDALMEAEGITRKAAEERTESEAVIAYLYYRSEHPDWADLVDAQSQAEHDGIGWARLRQMVVAVAGISVEGIPVTSAEEIIERCPPEFTDEVIDAAEQVAGLGAAERGELLWPGTSPKPEAGPMADMTVPCVANAPAAA